MRIRSWVVPLLFASFVYTGCGNRDGLSEVSAAIPPLLAAQPLEGVRAESWADVRDFYQRREHVPAWIADNDRTTADVALRVIRSARDHGLDEADYGEAHIATLLATWRSEDGFGAEVDRARALAELDVRTTTALLALGRDVALGRLAPQRIDQRWKARREPPDFVGTLIAAMAGDLNTWLETIRPQHPQYAALQKALSDLRAPGANVQPGQGAAPDPSVDARVTHIALNLERWRWMPDDLGARHIMVNIPTFQLVARDNGPTALQMRVVVGTPEHKTPVFSDQMSTVVFSPYWNVPDSIVEGETAPAAARDPTFLERNQIDILRLSKKGATLVDPSSVDWDDPAALKELAFRQRPGAKNALGHVKFLFPNPYEVYLHDTPADLLFARRGRAFSHGCVRVEQPEALARWVLRDFPEWTDTRIVEAMNAGVEKQVNLKQDIPVHIVYFTAWADDTGTVRVDPDVYGWDAVQSGLRAEL